EVTCNVLELVIQGAGSTRRRPQVDPCLLACGTWLSLLLVPGERPSILVQQLQRLERVVDHAIHPDSLAFEESQVEDRVVNHQRQVAPAERLHGGPELGEG